MTADERPALSVPDDEARAGDADREAVAERLRVAAGEGRINFEELDERLGHAYGAGTYGQLRALLADLPAVSAGKSQVEALPEPETLVLATRAPNLRQSGRWVVPQRITAETASGWITIDFTQATCAHREVAVDAVCQSGWIRLILPDGWAARISPASTNTSHMRNKAPETAEPGAPTVIVTGHPAAGYIRIRQRRRKR
jgi:Domain of unknown function (DUF1707)